jgi:hypothetical protein
VIRILLVFDQWIIMHRLGEVDAGSGFIILFI